MWLRGRGRGGARRDGDGGGFEQAAHVVSRRRDLTVGGSTADDHLDEAEAGEHDHEGVAAGAVFVAQADRPPLELHRLRVAERPLHPDEVLVAVVHALFGDGGLRQIGAQRVSHRRGVRPRPGPPRPP